MPRLVAPLTDMRVKNAKPKAKAYKLADGGGMYLEITPSGSKLWRMKFMQSSGKESRLSFGAYPEVTLTQARAARAAARQLKATDVDPGQAKRDVKLARAAAALNSFEAIARQWLTKTAAERAESTQAKNTAWLERNIFPEIGSMPISTIKPRDVLGALQKIEARGAIESAHKIKQICGQIFRHAVASGLAERDVTVDLRDALACGPCCVSNVIARRQHRGRLGVALEKGGERLAAQMSSPMPENVDKKRRSVTIKVCAFSTRGVL